MKSGFLCLCVSGVLSVVYQTEKAVLRKLYFRLVKNYIHASSPWTNIKLPAHVIRHEFVSEVEFNRIAARNLSFIFPCFCLIKENNERYFLRFTQQKVSPNVNDKMFSDFTKKEKTLYLRGSVFDRLTEYISTLAFNPNLGSGVCIPLRPNFSLCGNSVFIFFISSKRLEIF